MKSHSILIIEDDPAILFGLRENFDIAGYEVHSSVDGNLGLELAREKRPDIILLDIMLPGINGFEICQLLRREQCDAPIIMLTALGQEENIIKGLNFGADDYVTKPFSIAELMARVKNFLKRYKSQQHQVHHFGEFTFNSDSLILTRDRETIELSPKEAAMLAYLLRRPGCALTRDHILDAVWGSDIIVTERSVDRCVTSLRSKIETNSARPQFLKTVQKVGYRWEA